MDQNDGPQFFPTTIWTMVHDADDAESPAVQAEALAKLLGRYAPAMKAHLTRRKRVPPEQAEDLVQGFIMGKVLEKNLLGQADKARGKFRTFLLTALDRYAISEFRAATAQKRGGGNVAPLDALAEPSDAADEADTFDTEWARGVLGQAIDAMQAECEANSRPDVWGIFNDRLLKPTLEQTPPPEYDELVKRYQIANPTQASNLLITGKRMFARCLQAVIADYADGEDAVKAEMDDLMNTLSRLGQRG
jgi:RNA polymerase sigma-70 factor (ECF subfamily)